MTKTISSFDSTSYHIRSYHEEVEREEAKEDEEKVLHTPSVRHMMMKKRRT